jgi:3-phenylpropionate/trans-cinnamate dioxygenase ferredoxin reductase subunit
MKGAFLESNPFTPHLCDLMNNAPAMVIVGAGHVGGRAAQALREFGWAGPIMLVGAEPHLPYERPPLSKALLTGERTAAQCALRAPETYAAENITHFVSKVDAIAPAARQITLADGRRFPYLALLLATGGQLRWIDIPGAHLPGVLGLRTLDDAAALAPRLVARTSSSSAAVSSAWKWRRRRGPAAAVSA